MDRFSLWAKSESGGREEAPGRNGEAVITPAKTPRNVTQRKTIRRENNNHRRQELR